MAFLNSSNEYFTFEGVVNKELEKLAETQENAKWRENEINFDDDYTHFCKLTEPAQKMFKNTLSFLAISDSLINKNLIARFINEVDDPSARRFYMFQMVMEEIHSRTYGLMLKAIVPDREERAALLRPHKNSPAIKAKIDWIEKWIDGDYPFYQRLVAFAIAESILFSPSFVPFFWAKKKGILHGLATGNDFIVRDEGLHCTFALLLNTMLIERCSEELIHTMMREAVAVECIYVNETLPLGVPELTNVMLREYIEFSADAWLPLFLTNEGRPCSKLYGRENPIMWMERANLPGTSDFFERRESGYQTLSTTTTQENKDTPVISDDF